jgi:acetyl-CoA acetyltransferase
MHAADLLAVVQRAVVERAGIDPHDVGQVVAACNRSACSRRT